MADVVSKNNGTITPVQQMISSCTGALLTSVFVTPLDVVKVRLQAQQKQRSRPVPGRGGFSSSRCFLHCNGFVEEICCTVHSSNYWYRTSGHLTGTLDAFVKITRTEGLASLWSGLPPTLLMAVPSTVVYFTLYDQMRYHVIRRFEFQKQPLWLPVAAGGVARAISATLISPLELIRTKMQSQKMGYLEIHKAIRAQVLSHGITSMWTGLGPTVLRDVPFSAVYWLNYEILKEKFGQQQPSFWFSFGAGATSGSIAALLTLPFDVIKTHRQIELGETATVLRRSRVSTYSLMKNLYNSSGFKALFAGAVPRVIKIAPACAIMISTYEYGKKFFKKYNATA